MLKRDFYQRDANTVAPELLGKLLVHKTEQGIVSGKIVEVEAYVGSTDKGAHSYPNKRTSRTEIQFGPGGYAYVYLIYGLHCCFNIVTSAPNCPEVVLIRSLEPVDGIELMRRRRRIEDIGALCNGPGKLCEAMGITRENYGEDLCGDRLYLEEGPVYPKEQIAISPRINIDCAEECKDYLWRYYVKGNTFVSKVPPHYRAMERNYNP